jgi:uroporphyrinogen decarboxylase
LIVGCAFHIFARMILKNDLLLRAARGEKTERIPVWLMRQAGRILPEYREIRSKLSGFKELVETPELAAEVTIQPVDILGVDAAIIFSDILVIPEAMGLTYEMAENTGPYFKKVIRSSADIDQLKIADASDLHYTLEAIQIVKKQLGGKVPVIGFAGAPWTILSYMIEGKGSKTFSKAKKFLYTENISAHTLLEKITSSTINYLQAQIRAGADIVQIFDSWAGVLSPSQYKEFSLKYISAICDAITEVPVIIFAKGAHFIINDFGKINCSVIGLDWTMDIESARKEIKGKTIQGNMDPCLLYADEKTIQAQTINMLVKSGGEKYIANLGHGLYPDTEKEKVKLFVDTVKAYNSN